MTHPFQPPLLGEPAAAIQRVFGANPFLLDGDLLALAFAADGALWSVEEPGVLRCWDTAEQRQLSWRPLEELATLWCFGPGCRLLAAGSDDLSVWDSETGDVKAAWGPHSWATALAFHPDGRTLASGHDDGVVRLWDWQSQRLVRELSRRGPAVSAVAFSPDGAALAVAAEDKIIRLWDAASGSEAGRLVGHTDRIPALAWQPGGRRLASAGWDGNARVWDVASCQPVILLNGHTGQVHALAYSPDGGLLACADAAHAVHVWDAHTHRAVQVLRRQGGEVRCLAFSADGGQLAAGGVERAIRVCDPRVGDGDGRPVDPLQSRTGLLLTHQGNRLISVGPGAGLRVWDAATGQPAFPSRVAGPLRAVAADPDGKWILVSLGERKEDRQGPALLLRVRGANGQRDGLLEGPDSPVTALAFAPDGETFASGGYQSNDIWLWDAAAGAPKLILANAAGGCSVEQLLFRPQGRLLAVAAIDWLATSGSDGLILVWDVVDRKQVLSLPGGALALAFHPGGRRLASASLVQTVRVWDLETRQLTAELEGHSDAVRAAAFSPDGRWLASGGDDYTVRLWDADSGEARGLVELDTQVKALAFAPDGRSLFTGNGNASCYQLEVRQLLS
jgi:WD40 repeat protein